jgi:hypothetical protein
MMSMKGILRPENHNIKGGTHVEQGFLAYNLASTNIIVDMVSTKVRS